MLSKLPEVSLLASIFFMLVNAGSLKSNRSQLNAPIVRASSSESPGTNTESGQLSGLLSMLFPIPGFTESWTTCSESSDALPLDDETLVVSKDEKALPHNYGTFNGKNTMEAVFPEGSYIPSKEPAGGLSFYAAGPADVDLTTAKEATLGYSVFFPEDFDFVKGGKLPGLCKSDFILNPLSH